MKLKALQYLRYANMPVQAGEVFECKPADVRVLTAIRRAEVYVEPPPKRVAAVLKPIPVEVKEPVSFEDMVVSGAVTVEREPAKRAYKRRDMVSE